MANATCSDDGCAKPVHARGQCSQHYNASRRSVASCSVEGCGLAYSARGYCSTHYQRLKRYGDPHGGPRTRTPQGLAAAFLEQAAKHEGDECLLWPYAKSDNGYGRVGDGGYAHRQVLILAVGLPPFPKADAAHAPLICHNRLCVNPRHLRWATRAENIEDSRLDGTFRSRGRAKQPSSAAL